MDHSSHNMMGMDHTSNEMMIPYLHFVGSDWLLFKAWRPTSAGDMAGAAVGLFFFALLERWLDGVASVAQVHWRQRALQTSEHEHSDDEIKPRKAFPLRTIPPFMLSIDFPRGIMYAVQRLFGYTLMLAVMTFHAGYIIAILVGLGLGEMLFGRMAAGKGINHH